MESQQQSQKITLETLYKTMQEMKQELHQIHEKIDWENDFTEEENQEFIKGTRQAQKEIDEGKGVTKSEEEFLAEMETWGEEDESHKSS
jgi:predicted transcriptional regulator